MSTKADLTGKTYGRLIVVRQAARKVGENKKLLPPEWECICSCGNSVVVPAKMLQSGHKKSCGCLLKENTLPANNSKALKMQVLEQDRVWGPCPYPMFGCGRNDLGWCCDDCDEENCKKRCLNLPADCGCKKLAKGDD